MEVILSLLKLILFYWQTDRLDMMTIYEVPILTFLLLLTIWVLGRRKGRLGDKPFYLIYGLVTLLMFADAAYSSYFGKYISVNQLYQLGSLGTIAGDGNVIGAAVNPLCILTLLDYPLAVLWCRYSRRHKIYSSQIVWKFILGKKDNGWRQTLRKYTEYINYVWKLALSVISIFFFVYFAFNFNNERYVQKVNHIEFFTCHTNDLLVNVGGRMKRRNINEEEILSHMAQIVPISEGSQYRGVAKGKNLILIQVESLNDFVIGAEYEGQEITPNINALLEEDTLYFDRFYSTTGVGNTCDAEFATLNSLYANEERECYRMFVDNTFDGLPWMLRREGYSTMAFHGYIKTFWNRDEAYKNQGIEHYYSEEELELTEQSGFGLTDKEMFRQAVDILKTKQEPFFSFMITLTNHIPYDMPQRLATLKLAPQDENTMFGRYLQTVRYTDEAIGDLIQYLKEAGLYENTMIAFYGDHQGLNKETIEIKMRMTEYLGKEYDFDEMLKIPLVIHIPGLGERKVITTVGGEIDTMPTIANLMDLTIQQPYVFGHDLLNTREGFLAQISYIGKGSYIDGNNEMIMAIGKDGTVQNGYIRHIPDGGLMNINETLCEKQSARAIDLLDTCKEVLDNNLIANYVTH